MPDKPNRSRPASILIVDYDRSHCHLVEDALCGAYAITSLHSVDDAIHFLQETPTLPELFLLDLHMPEADGYTLLHAIKANDKTKNIPFIFVSAEIDPGLHEQALELGAIDYLLKPVQTGILKRKVEQHIQSRRRRNALHSHNRLLHEELAETIRELQLAQDATVLALATLTEIRNCETGEHIWRTQEYVKVLAQSLRHHERYRSQLTDKDIYLMYKTAPLHDIGKVGIPDEILNKPGTLDPGEMAVIQTHPLIGANALTQAEKLYGDSETLFLRYAREICCSHHERWDGAGYPYGLKGEEIPLSARIMAVADVYDAMVTRRAYKEPLEHDITVNYILSERGRAFDPDIVDVFKEVHLEFRAIAMASVMDQRTADYAPN